MAHPMHADAKSSAESKLKKLSGAHGTVDNPSGNKSAPGTMKEGPMKAVGLGVEGNKPRSSLGRYARGGAVKGKGTNVNIVISPPAAAPSAGMPPSIMPPPHIPQPGPAPAPPMPPGAAPGMPPGMPPGMMHKHGGRAYKKGGAVKLDAAAAVHKHEKHLHKGEQETKFTRGGKVGKYTAGAASGDGRLQKIENYGARSKAKSK